jgi:hypothetical protein
MSGRWQYLTNQQDRLTRIGPTFLVVMVLILCGCDEEISIVFREEEKWAANVSYDPEWVIGGGNPNKDFTIEIEEALSKAEELGVRGSRKADSLDFGGQGYNGLEELLELSRCCESAEIDIRTEDGERRVHFTLFEKDDPMVDWEINLYGDEIVSNSQTWHEERKGQAIWSEWHGKDDLKADFMKVVLTEKGSDLPMRVAMLLLPLFGIGIARFFTIKIERNRVGDSNQKSEMTTEAIDFVRKVTLVGSLAGFTFVWLWIKVPFFFPSWKWRWKWIDYKIVVANGMVVAICLVLLMINRRHIPNVNLKLRFALFAVLASIVAVWAGTIFVSELRSNLVDFALLAWIEVILVIYLVFLLVNWRIILNVFTREPTEPA